MLFSMLLFCTIYSNLEIKDVEIYQPIQRSEVIVRPDGHVLVLNFQEAKILEFNEEGELLKTIGSKGKGPGEFSYPTDFFYMSNLLYVFDMLSTEISVFDEQGVFIKRVKFPKRGVRLTKSKTGWVYITQGFLDPEAKPEVAWVDDQFENMVILKTYTDPGYAEGMMVMSDGTKTVAKFSPLSARPETFSNSDGSRVYLVDPEKSIIDVIDDAERKIVQTFDLGLKKIPFDVDWAEERLAEEKERSKGQINVKIQTSWPDTFPAFRQSFFSPLGHIALNRWAGRPDKRNVPLFLDETGEEIQSKVSWEAHERVMGRYGDNLWISIWDNEEEAAGLVLLPISEVNQFIKDNPIEFDGRGGRSISISM